MKSIGLNMASVEVKVETKAIRATWSPEIVKDIESYHNFDMSSFESYSSFSSYIAKELREEIRKENRKKSINKIFQN